MKNASLTRTWRVTSILVSFLLTISAVPLFAEEEKPTADATVSVLSKYVWRGQELSRNSAVIQPSLTVGYKGFSVNVWGNLDTNPYSSGANSYSSTWTETDATISYSKTLGLFNLGGGYIYYGLGAPNKDAPDPPDSQEIFALWV